MADSDFIVLSVQKAAKFYGSKLVFKNVDVQLHKGEVLLVAGPNGAGKSTLMKLMAGLSRPSAGEVSLNLPPEKTVYLGHSTFIYPGLSARANLSFWASMYGLSPSGKELDATLERVGLLRAANEKAGGFSRGMSQRLNLARVYLVQPELVFLDEPGTGLDVKSLAMLRADIADLRERGVSIVWISHHLAEDAAMVDTVLSLGSRRVEYYGPASGFDAGGLIC